MNSDERAHLNAVARSRVNRLYNGFSTAVKTSPQPNEVIEQHEFAEIKALFQQCCKKCETEVKVGTEYYRARIFDEVCEEAAIAHEKKDGFDKLGPDSFGIPPKQKGGRVNSSFLRCLYLANSEECALSEVRPSIDENVIIAEGFLLNTISCVSFLNVPWVSQPTDDIGCMIQLLNRMFSLPINRSPEENYKPTQMIALYIMLLGYEGLIFSSSQLKNPRHVENWYYDPHNLALFDERNWKPERSTFHRVFDKSYNFNRDPIMHIIDALS